MIKKQINAIFTYKKGHDEYKVDTIIYMLGSGVESGIVPERV